MIRTGLINQLQASLRAHRVTIKKILEKYEDQFDAAPYLGIVFTVFAIFFCAHMLACFWFLTGTGSSHQEPPAQWPFTAANCDVSRPARTEITHTRASNTSNTLAAPNRQPSQPSNAAHP